VINYTQLCKSSARQRLGLGWLNDSSGH